jgi:hypothetical protein
VNVFAVIDTSIITDFSAGTSGDILDLHNLEAAVGYAGHNALADNAVRLIQNGANTEVQVDTHYGASLGGCSNASECQCRRSYARQFFALE